MGTRIKGFDGLRALAVLLVFFQHKAGLGSGHLGVWIFFVLSGYLITGILAKQRLSIEFGASHYMRELSYFMFRRTIRIFPIYYLVLSFLSICILIGFLSQEYRAGLPYHYAYLSNIWIGQMKQEWDGPFSHFWSLAIEEQFYLLFAPLLLALHVRRHWQVCVLLIFAGLVSLWFFKHSDARNILIYTHPLTNFWLLALGGLGYHLTRHAVASWRTSMRHALIPAGAMVAIIALYASEKSWINGPAGVYTLGQFLYGLCIAMLVCWIASNENSRVVALLETKWLAALGRISYGFYLYQALVPSLATGTRVRLLFGGMEPPDWLHVIDVPVIFLLTVSVSWLFWRLVEKPILRFKDRVPASMAQAESLATLNSRT